MEVSDIDRRLGEEQAMIAQSVAEFARERVLPHHEALDHAATHPEELWGEIAELGLFSTFAPEEAGGAGAGFVGHVVTVESLARAGGIAGVLPVAQGIAIDALLQSGSEAGGGRLEGLLMGETLGAPALQEDDAGWIACRAEGAGDEVMLTGAKVNVPFPGRAGLFVVLARRNDEPLLALVDGGAAGLDHGPADATLGLLGFECGSLRLDGVPGIALGGADLVARVVTGARIGVAALLAGIARGAVDHAVRYAGERKQFDKELNRFTAIQEHLGRADLRAEALRALVHAAAALRDAGEPHAHAARRARLAAAEDAVLVGHAAVQVYGGYGYSREYPVERFYRDARFPGFGEFHPAALLAEATAELG